MSGLGNPLLAGPLALLALASCGFPEESPCTRSGKPVPLVNIGPDVSVKVLCQTFAEVPVASIGNVGGGDVRWAATLEGDPSVFSIQSEGSSCGGDQTQVLRLGVLSPASNAVGHVLEATITVRSDGDLFPGGTVRARAEIVGPSFRSAPAAVEFGDVAQGTTLVRTLAFSTESSGPLLIEPPIESPAPFRLDGKPDLVPPGRSVFWTVWFDATTVGDHQAVAVWSARSATNVNDAGDCVATRSVPIHARVVANGDAGADGGGGDAGVDAADGDAAPDR